MNWVDLCYTWKSTFTFQWESYWIVFHPWYVSQQLHQTNKDKNIINFYHNPKSKTQRSPWVLREPLNLERKSRTQMQILKWMDMVVIEEYYCMTTMNADMKWMKLRHLLLTFSLNLRTPFCTFTFTSIFLIAFSNVHTREKKYISLVLTM